jgi:hypothetical protein
MGVGLAGRCRWRDNEVTQKSCDLMRGTTREPLGMLWTLVEKAEGEKQPRYLSRSYTSIACAVVEQRLKGKRRGQQQRNMAVKGVMPQVIPR